MLFQVGDTVGIIKDNSNEVSNAFKVATVNEDGLITGLYAFEGFDENGATFSSEIIFLPDDFLSVVEQEFFFQRIILEKRPGHRLTNIFT